jgi:hypothetical protein
LIVLDQRGEPILTVDTDDFLPESVCFGSDGGIWLFGMDSLKHGEASDLLRKYSFDGDLVRSALPLGSLPDGFDHPLDSRYMRVFTSAGSKLGLASGQRWTWLDLSAEGRITGIMELPDTPDGPSARLALAASGELYADGSGKLFRLNRADGEWEAVEIRPSVPCGPLELVGTDGPHIVFAERCGYPLRLFWFAESDLLSPGQHQQ